MRKLFSLLIVNLLLLSAGCQERKSKNVVQIEKQPHSALRQSSVQASSLRQAQDRAGQADLNLAVSARFLQSDKSWYLTEQRHEITIEPKALTISAREPFGKIVLSVKKGNFNSQIPSNGFDKQLLEIMTDEGICRGLLELYLAEIKGNPQSKSSQTSPFLFEGQQYELVSNENGIEIYKNKSTSKADLVIISGNKRYILFGYNYLEFEKGRHFPSKIDVYANNSSERLLIAQFEGQLLTSSDNK